MPGRGPGRAVNGNFSLTGLRLQAHPRGMPAQAVDVALRNPKADFSQESYGGWPVAAVLDDNPETGWSVDPEEGRPHVAQFEFEKLVGFEGGTTLLLELGQGTREHSLGRFRLSVTAATPVPPPQRHEPPRFQVSGQAPGLPVAGLLVVTVEMSRRDGGPHEIRNVGDAYEAVGTLAGRPMAWRPVLGRKTYPSAWQAWRLPLPAAATEQPFGLTVTPRLGADTVLKWQAYWVGE